MWACSVTRDVINDRLTVLVYVVAFLFCFFGVCFNLHIESVNKAFLFNNTVLLSSERLYQIDDTLHFCGLVLACRCWFAYSQHSRSTFSTTTTTRSQTTLERTNPSVLHWKTCPGANYCFCLGHGSGASGFVFKFSFMCHFWPHAVVWTHRWTEHLGQL